MSFQDLSPESQQMARETLAEILKLEREHAYDLSDGQSKDIAKFVKDAFIELEKVNATQNGQALISQNLQLSTGALGIQQGHGIAMSGDKQIS
ncbi:hypothetical protein [Proteus mirabilis]|uniref:hypothetical protein n=1 Tax=Proteus mirabilis TaxID=584 RepID=UPI00254DF00C|nr:hypothetical protein [Proteus mirabilis]MDK6999235.1 hypothetical protein [Proteus mirabilis]MDK7017185.1 hypothetical protein [Proteus mirabilis]MDK8619004.1 hypothetical protein [Proteus mirabilis]